MTVATQNDILADGRWQGQHGIGRFSTEIVNRLQHADIITQGPPPLSMQNLIWQSYRLTHQQTHRIYFSPGFNPPLLSAIPFVFTVHDLIHLHIPGNAKVLKKIYYEMLIKPAARRAYKIITVSEFSKQRIIDWACLPSEKIVVVGNGVSSSFSATGSRYEPGFPYLLHVGNMKPHKNVARLIEAFKLANIDKGIRLICTGIFTEEIKSMLQKWNLTDSVLSHSNLNEAQLAAYYRGALGVTFPSLYEGFGLPVLEGMASGVPVLCSNTTSLPEVAGDAAILVDPTDIDAITHGLQKLVTDSSLRDELIRRGLIRAKSFSWDMTAQKVQMVLDSGK